MKPASSRSIPLLPRGEIGNGFSRFTQNPSRGGFALVATLMLMMLLAVLAVGLLSLSSISLRGTSQGGAQAEAQANARMALMLAIGELQKELGPDQRISARAEILDTDPSSDQANDVANPHYLGVWDSWDTWLTDRKGSLSIQDTYKPGRDPSLFRKWLVSDPDSNKLETATTAAESEGMIELCSDRSAGTSPSGQVKVPRVLLQSGGRATGSYAWWISDESQKARLDLEPRETTDTPEAALASASRTGRMGIEKMSRMSDYDTSPASLAKMISVGQAGLSAREADSHFHDLTAHSLGLLTDVRFGGFKGDLNLAFESDRIPEEMDEAKIFGGRPYDAPIRPMTGELENIVPANPYVAPMSWRQLREYYRLYRDFSDGHIKHPVKWSGDEPYTRRYLMRGGELGDWNAGGYARQLVVLRQTWVLATSSKNNPKTPGGVDYFVLAVPVVTIWNPYNIALKMGETEISSFGSLTGATGLRYRTYKGDSTTSGSFIDANGVQSGLRMIPVGPGGSGAVEFQPGEVRIFSTDAEITAGRYIDSDDAMPDRHFLATPGYTPVQDTGTVRGLKYKVNPPTSGAGALTMSLSIDNSTGGNTYRYIGTPRRSAVIWQHQEVLVTDKDAGSVHTDGSNVTKKDEGEWQDVIRIGLSAIDWVTPAELGSAWIVNDDAPARARWGAPDSPPMPIGIYSVVAKSAERLAYGSSQGFAKDYRNRSWLHAPPTGLVNLLMNPVDLNRADSPYQIHFRPVNGDAEVSQYLQADGRNGFFGGGFTPARGQSHLSMLSLPIAPVRNLGSLAGVRIEHAHARIVQEHDTFSDPSVEKSGLGKKTRDFYLYKYKHLGHSGGAFGAGVGNAYAHPMIGPEQVYTRNSFGTDPGNNGSRTTKMAVTDDYWDHLFLANEELWDSWFFSGIAPEVSQGQVTTPKKTVAKNFFAGESSALSPHFQPHLQGKTPDELADLVEATSEAPGENGWDLIASHMLNKGQFNVNSTSKEAWKALLMSLADRPIASNETGSGLSVTAGEANQASLSRHLPTNGKEATGGPLDEHAWRGIRKLSEAQIDKLAEQIVRQVKLRGPFLNMAEFINRRLSPDATGVTGALQAAIDWDEFDAGYDGSASGTGESINKAYKQGDAMIAKDDLPAPYPNPEAAAGSRYAGIPGYVMQSDILQGISSSLSVRGDTFLIRTCGQSFAADGSVNATAWCEAVVQRMPEYVDPADPDGKKLRSAGQPPSVTQTLQPLNQTFGRQFQIVSFRWLNPAEI